MILKNSFNISDSHASIFLNFIAKAMGLITIIYLANIFDQDFFGLYSYLIALSSFIAVFIKLGLPPYLTKSTSSLLANQNYSKIKSLWIKINRFLSLALVILLTLFLIIYLIDTTPSENNITLFDLLACFLIAFSISFSEIRSSMIRGMGYIKSGLFPENFIRPILFLLCLFLVSAFYDQNITLILFIFLGAYIFSNSVSQFIIYRISKTEIDERNIDIKKKFKIEPNEIISYFSFSFLQILMSQFCILLFPFFSSYEELALFRIAFSGGFLLTVVLMAIAAANINKFAGFYSKKDYRKLNKYANKCSAMSASYSTILILVACILAPYAIDFLLDNSYSDSLIPFYIIAFGQLFNCFFGLASSILQMSKFQFHNNISLGIAIFVGVIFFIIFVENTGAFGASIAYTSCLITYVLLSQFFCKLKIGFFVNPFSIVSRV